MKFVQNCFSNAMIHVDYNQILNYNFSCDEERIDEYKMVDRCLCISFNPRISFFLMHVVNILSINYSSYA